MGRKLIAIYKTVAVVLLNTALLASLVVAALAIWLPEPQPRGRIYSKKFDLSSYSRIPRRQARRVGKEFDRMGERQSYEFYPWTVFRERPFEGKFVTVSPARTRGTAPPAPRLEHQRELTVWAFGGSTMFGWGMPDSQTIASHLQALLQEGLSDHHVRVTNHGHSYYFTSMELSLLIALLREEPKPDIAVFLEGLNDGAILAWGLPVPFFSDVAYRAWERERELAYRISIEKPWITIHDNFPPLRLLRGREDRQRPAGFRRPRKSRYYTKSEDPVGYALGHFHANRKMLEAVGAAMEVEMYQFLQPIKGYAPGRPYRGKYDLLAAFYDAVLEQRPEDLHSIVDALAGTKKPWVDATHYSDEGCYQVARAMAAVILENRATAREEIRESSR